MLIMLLIVRGAREICSNQSKALLRPGYWHVISMEFLQSFLRRHFAGESVVVSRNVGCFLRLRKRSSHMKRPLTSFRQIIFLFLHGELKAAADF